EFPCITLRFGFVWYSQAWRIQAATITAREYADTLFLGNSIHGLPTSYNASGNPPSSGLPLQHPAPLPINAMFVLIE
ncbi:MAG: hypothetical protein ACR2Q4_21870, partial [Geminicoccaceae bacterium]